MTRKKFFQDLEKAKDNPPAHITNVERYDGDGVSFCYWYVRAGNQCEVCLKLITTDLDDYPDGNQYMLFTDDLDVDPAITDTIVQLQAIFDGSIITTVLQEISEGLHQALTLGQRENPITFDSSSQIVCDTEVDDFELNEEDDDANFGLEDLAWGARKKVFAVHERASGNGDINIVKSDLRAAKTAGFKIGFHGKFSSAGIICVSIRVAKLGISEEAMQAWGLSGNQYLLLLIRFQQGYKSLEDIIYQSALTGPVEIRVGLSNTYKPTKHEALAAFSQTEDGLLSQPKSKPTKSTEANAHETLNGTLRPLFIGRPINDLLRNRFAMIVKFRHQFDLSWGGAERLFNDRQGALLSDLSKDMEEYRNSSDDVSSQALPDIATADMLSELGISQASLPLVAMQFVLRHLVRCTEFCLVCHCRVDNTFEALKPYVCSSPLCLYQFLALGFGPAAEWEILTQPYVVDLLISLCYVQAIALRLREFPLGINLKVPSLPRTKIWHQCHPSLPGVHRNTPKDTNTLPEPKKAFKAKYYSERKVLLPMSGSWSKSKPPCSKGEWIVLVDDQSELYHCQIADEQGLEFLLGTVIHRPARDVQLPANNEKKGDFPATREVDCYRYDMNFDELPDQSRQQALLSLLDTLPTVENMRKALSNQQGGHRDADLNLLRKQCPQPALDLLRWIIASNRSCIMQVDQVVSDSSTNMSTSPSEDRVSGMDSWMQFRFAQGAPDKEQRFVECVANKSANTACPTLFAWHGSPLHNWHSIIRQGLNFDEISHGRANGHGVYMSPFLATSMGYCSSPLGGSQNWPNSELKVSSVVSLQEVVNAPASFVSRTPHFVVAEKDWIQTRYLFVKTTARLSTRSTTMATYSQDPAYLARGMDNTPVSIPITAISKSRRTCADALNKPKSKKRKTVSQDHYNSIDELDDGVSVATDEEDVRLLAFIDDDIDEDDFEQVNVFDNDSEDVEMSDFDDETAHAFDDQLQKGPLSSQAKKRNIEHNFILDSSKTDFVPDTLDTSDIRFLDPPKYASRMATNALMRAFNETLTVQRTTPLHELGFYLDANRVENMYQWIVELHSFESTLPLAQDMKAAKISSIVLEMQYASDFPYSPPFVRVVRPRFLDPMLGGGGHITSGGAICMELLTTTGWSAANSIESVLFQVRLAMTERERPARLLRSRNGFQTSPYGIGEAIAAYKRFCTRHGWQAPKGLDEFQTT